LDAYSDGLTTAEAIPHALNTSQEEFERGYRAYLEEIAAGLSGFESTPKGRFADLLEAHRKNPDDSDLAAELAYGYLRRGAYEEARQLAAGVPKNSEKYQRAAYVLGRILVRAEKSSEAVKLLESRLDSDNPDAKVLNLLAALDLKEENYAEAARWYRLGARLQPQNLRWVRALALVHTRSQNEGPLADALERLAAAEADNLTARKELARLALARRDYAAAEKWANQAIEIDVQDADIHRAFAEALAGRHNYAQAIDEYRVAIELDPAVMHTRMALADAYVQSGQPGEARRVLEELLQRTPDYPGADVLLESLKESDPP
jgi:tetratricopeptide (TPR) repeat protein